MCLRARQGAPQEQRPYLNSVVFKTRDPLETHEMISVGCNQQLLFFFFYKVEHKISEDS